MSNVTVKTLGICVVQLVATESLSLVLFGCSPHLVAPIYTALLAPIAILCLPVFSFLDKEFVNCIAFLALDIVLVLAMGFLIVRNYKLIGSLFLLAFNVLSIVFTFAAY